MTKRFLDLSFSPEIQGVVPTGSERTLNIFTGTNNSGKSAYLEQTIDREGKHYIGVNRFYSFHHLAFYSENISETQQALNNL